MTSMDLDSRVELLDSEILQIEQGPIAWANSKVGSSQHIDQFCRDLVEQFASIGLQVHVNPWTTRQEGTYAFSVEIIRRVEPKVFDFDRMKHEVRADILGLGTGGTIPFDEKEFLRKHGNGKHGHG